MKIDNEVDGLWLIFVELTQLLDRGLVPAEADPNAIVDVAIETLKAVSSVATRDVRDDSQRYAILHLDDRPSERFMLVVGHCPGYVPGPELSDGQGRPERQKHEKAKGCQVAIATVSIDHDAPLHLTLDLRCRVLAAGAHIPMYSGV